MSRVNLPAEPGPRFATSGIGTMPPLARPNADGADFQLYLLRVFCRARGLYRLPACVSLTSCVLTFRIDAAARKGRGDLVRWRLVPRDASWHLGRRVLARIRAPANRDSVFQFASVYHVKMSRTPVRTAPAQLKSNADPGSAAGQTVPRNGSGFRWTRRAYGAGHPAAPSTCAGFTMPAISTSPRKRSRPPTIIALLLRLRSPRPAGAGLF